MLPYVLIVYNWLLCLFHSRWSNSWSRASVRESVCSLLINSCLFLLWGNCFNLPTTTKRTCYMHKEIRKRQVFVEKRSATKEFWPSLNWSCFLLLLSLSSFYAISSVHSTIKLKVKGDSTILYAFVLPLLFLCCLLNRWPQEWRNKSIKKLQFWTGR